MTELTFFCATGSPPPGYAAPSVVPDAPTLFVSLPSASIVVEWLNNAVNALAIEIWRSVTDVGDPLNPQPFELVYTANAYREITWTDPSTYTSSNLYAYKARAVNYAGASAFTAEVNLDGSGLLTEDGFNLMTEEGQNLLVEDPS